MLTACLLLRFLSFRELKFPATRLVTPKGLGIPRRRLLGNSVAASKCFPETELPAVPILGDPPRYPRSYFWAEKILRMLDVFSSIAWQALRSMPMQSYRKDGDDF